jgi:hypothetical protein
MRRSSHRLGERRIPAELGGLGKWGSKRGNHTRSDSSTSVTPAFPLPQAGDITMIFFEMEDFDAMVIRQRGVIVTRLIGFRHGAFTEGGR